jgi:hypothetical protein
VYGHARVSRDLKRRVEARLPARLAAIRADSGDTLAALPDPAKVLPYFLPYIDIGSYPTICITELDTPTGLSGAQKVRQGTRFDSYVYRYPFRMWVYLRGVDYGITEMMLKNYLTGMREVLLENRVLTHNDDAHVTIDPTTISENFDSPMENAARQILGVGFIGVILESTEVINLTTVDPRAELPTDIDGTVSVLDRFTNTPTGDPRRIPGGLS